MVRRVTVRVAATCCGALVILGGPALAGGKMQIQAIEEAIARYSVPWTVPSDQAEEIWGRAMHWLISLSEDPVDFSDTVLQGYVPLSMDFDPLCSILRRPDATAVVFTVVCPSRGDGDVRHMKADISAAMLMRYMQTGATECLAAYDNGPYGRPYSREVKDCLIQCTEDTCSPK